QMILPLQPPNLWRALPPTRPLWLRNYSPFQKLCVNIVLCIYISPQNRSTCLSLPK
uniref:Uncharacterized protein n=1 Tax=Macaca fascicularis TaxID=9541 RepID=A0A7N9CVC2_MACFA